MSTDERRILYYKPSQIVLERFYIDSIECFKPIHSIIVTYKRGETDISEIYYTENSNPVRIEANSTTAIALGYLLEKLGYKSIPYVLKDITGENTTKQCMKSKVLEKLNTTSSVLGDSKSLYGLFYLHRGQYTGLFQVINDEGVLQMEFPDSYNTNHYIVSIKNKLHLIKHKYNTGYIEYSYYHPKTGAIDSWKRLKLSLPPKKEVYSVYGFKNYVYIYVREANTLALYNEDGSNEKIISSQHMPATEMINGNLFSYNGRLCYLDNEGTFYSMNLLDSSSTASYITLNIPKIPFIEYKSGRIADKSFIKSIIGSKNNIVIYYNSKSIYPNKPYKQMLFVYSVKDRDPKQHGNPSTILSRKFQTSRKESNNVSMGNFIGGKWLYIELDIDLNIEKVGYDELGIVTNTGKETFYLLGYIPNEVEGEDGKYKVYIFDTNDMKVTSTSITLPGTITINDPLLTIRLSK